LQTPQSIYFAWDFANYGSLHVQVVEEQTEQ